MAKLSEIKLGVGVATTEELSTLSSSLSDSLTDSIANAINTVKTELTGTIGSISSDLSNSIDEAKT